MTESTEPGTASGALLRRQTLYLASYDRTSGAAAWTAHALHHRRDLLARRGWSPHSAEARSTATALAPLGDPQPLLDLIERALVDDDDDEAANLNYMALWFGALALPQADDDFMRDRSLSGWDPITLLRHLAARMPSSPGFADLHAHSLWALAEAYPWLPMAGNDLGGTLATHADRLLDSPGLSSRARRELAGIRYVFDHNR
ncbi:hypothetical protein ACFY1V_18185 [Streptomyces sp. NPDC001255]|uniref:hypothetical protein n=1 Tax=Streptomyces sp. NPDC001255 TaxID=3364550 RepID=UPI00367F9846